MSALVPREAIQVIAQSVGVPNLSPDAANCLAPDLEYRLREIIQEAIKCMRHSRRTTLMVDDVDGALSLKKLEPVYGFASSDPSQLKRGPGYEDLFYINDKDVDFKEVLETPLPKSSPDVFVTSHWLAIEGIQPAIPENTSAEANSDGKKLEYREDGLPAFNYPISKDLQDYYEKITEFTLSRSESTLFRKAVRSLGTDSGLQLLIPYFTCFISDEVTKNLGDSRVLFALMRVVRGLLQNPHMHIEPYLHQLMPPIFTCIMAKYLGNKVSDNHWDLRSFSASVMALACKKFGHVYHNMQPRVIRTLIHVLLDPRKTLPQHYGAIQGLSALGPNVVRHVILPNLEAYMNLLLPEMLLESQKDEIKRQEAWRVYGVLMVAVGISIHGKLRLLPALLSPSTPVKSVTKNGKPSALQNARKGSMDNLVQQTQSAESIGRVMPAQMHGPSSSLTTVDGVPNSGMSGQLSNNFSGIQAFCQGIKAAHVLSQSWRNDLNAGHLLPSLFEIFGESVFMFIPKSELALFL